MLAYPAGYRNSTNHHGFVEDPGGFSPKAQKLNRKTFMFNKTVREPQVVGKIKGFVGCDGASSVLDGCF